MLAYQADNLIGHLTVRQNVAAARRIAGIGDDRSVEVLLGRLGLTARAEAVPAQL